MSDFDGAHDSIKYTMHKKTYWNLKGVVKIKVFEIKTKKLNIMTRVLNQNMLCAHSNNVWS